MSPNRIWSTVKYLRLEKTLLAVPRRQRAALRSFANGRWME
ncbi:MAG: hypothetical protein OEM29_04840 [Thermoplasmata archaeon]|nr:hypothetical protein [Thermoplasmata archaeon]